MGGYWVEPTRNKGRGGSQVWLILKAPLGCQPTRLMRRFPASTLCVYRFLFVFEMQSLKMPTRRRG